MVWLKFIFSEKQITFQKYGFMDIFAYVGGMGASCGFMLSTLAGIKIFIYFRDLISVIQKRYVEEERIYRVRELREKLSAYKAVIESQDQPDQNDLILIQKLMDKPAIHCSPDIFVFDEIEHNPPKLFDDINMLSHE